MPSTLPAKTPQQLQPLFSREPFQSLREEFENLMSRFFEGDSGFGYEFIPSLDLVETDASLEVSMDVPGIQPENINVEVVGNTLRIQGERKEESEEKGKTYHRVERHVGSFSRSVTLPCSVQEDSVQAEYHDGVLKITLPKTEESRPHRIQVKAT